MVKAEELAALILKYQPPLVAFGFMGFLFLVSTPVGVPYNFTPAPISAFLTTPRIWNLFPHARLENKNIHSCTPSNLNHIICTASKLTTTKKANKCRLSFNFHVRSRLG
jgi:hypothetical protein